MSPLFMTGLFNYSKYKATQETSHKPTNIQKIFPNKHEEQKSY